MSTETTHQNDTQTQNGVTPPEEFNASNITITDPRKKKNKKGETSFNALILHNGRPLFLETPWLRAPFGASMYEKDGKKNYSLALNPIGRNFDDEDEKAAIGSFFDELESLDNLMLDYGWKNRGVGIFSEPPEVKPVVKALYSRCIKQDKEKEYPRRLNLTLPKARDNDNKILDTVPNFDVFKGSKDPLPIESFEQLIVSVNGKPADDPGLIAKGCFNRCILQPRIWFIAGKFGLSWNVIALELKTITKVNVRGKYSFSRPDDDLSEEEDDEVNDEEAESSGEEEVEEEGSGEDEVEDEVEDSEEEEVEEVEEED